VVKGLFFPLTPKNQQSFILLAFTIIATIDNSLSHFGSRVLL